MNNIWFFSDTHLSHETLMKKLPRPFSNIKEMNETILNNFFSLVKKGDLAYFIGDLAWDKIAMFDFFEKIKQDRINLYFIYGNHDEKIISKNVLDKYCRWHGWIKDIKIGEQKITLCHYMMLSWNCSHWGAWHLHGHHHDKQQSGKAVGKVMNACVDLHDFKPIHFDQVSEYMKTRPDNWDLIKR